MEMRLELVIIPVTDVDRARDFYVDRLGFACDIDSRVSPTVRFVQLTPPGSACSIALGEGLTDAEPGSVQGLQVVVDDADTTREDLLSRGLDPGAVDEQPWGRFLRFADPDGNRWSVQQLPARG